MNSRISSFAPYIVLASLFVAAELFRPILPIDETRYMSVAWEMFVQKHYAVLSLNFHPYHHKPPMLFWLINGMWGIFGVSRWAALIPVYVASASVLFLTGKVAQRLALPQAAQKSVPWLMLGSVPFLAYSTLIMFDMMVCAFFLATMLVLLDYAKKSVLSHACIAGLLIGLGVLTKGPVMYLYVLWPALLYPYWRQDGDAAPKAFYKGVGIAVAISAIPVFAWLIPALMRTGNNFAFWLVWNQTAGRVTGNFSSAHVRPFYFYLYLLPLLFLPWAFMPSFWKKGKTVLARPAFRFLAASVIPAFVCFSLIAGKQPHYLLPFLPFIIIGIGFVLADVSLMSIKKISLAMIVLVMAGQAIAHWTFFPNYDLRPMVSFYQSHENKNWAYVRKYQGEIGFLARIKRPVDSLEFDELPAWFEKHPNGYAIVRYGDNDDMSAYDQIFSMDYRSRTLGVFKQKN